MSSNDLNIQNHETSNNDNHVTHEVMLQNTRWVVPIRYYDLKSLKSGGYGSVWSVIV